MRELTVVLPAPDGPTSATSWPGSTVAVMPLSTGSPAWSDSGRPPSASSDANDTRLAAG